MRRWKMVSMLYKRGTIFPARLNPARGAEPGKIRPVLILQADDLTVAGHTTVVIVPLTTNLIDAAPLRFRISKREKLHNDSDLMCDQIRAVDIRRLGTERIATLTHEEMLQIETRISLILSFSC